MLFMKARRKAEVGELDMAAPVEENIVWFDIPNIK